MAEKSTSPTCLPPELPETVRKLQSISSRYYELGVQLNVETNKLDAIDGSNKTPYRKLTDVLVCWLKNDETHSWDEIRKALRNIEEIKLAEEIQADTQSRPRRCAIAMLPPPPPPAEDTTVTSAWKKYRHLKSRYGLLLTHFREYLEELGIKRVKDFLQDTICLGCEDYSSEKILERMKSSMNLHVYNITPIQELVEVFPNEEMSYNVKAYCQWKEQFLDSTPVCEFFVQGSASPDVCKIKLKVQSSLVCDRETKLKFMDDLVQETFGPFYDDMLEMEHPHHSEETFCWRFPTLKAVKAIVHVQRNLDVLNKKGVEEVTVDNFQLMPCYCQGFSATSPPVRSLSVTPTEGNAHLELQNRSLQTELTRLRTELTRLQTENQDLQSQIEDLESQKAQQKRKGDEATEDDDTEPSTCQQKCVKLEKEMEEVHNLYHTILQASEKVRNMRENRLKTSSSQLDTGSSIQLSCRLDNLHFTAFQGSSFQGFKMFDEPVKEKKYGLSYSQVERHWSKTIMGFLKENEQFLNQVLVKRIIDRLQDVTLEGESCVRDLTNLFQLYIASDVVNPVFMKGRITGRKTTTVEQWRTMAKELFENISMTKQEKVMAEELTEDEWFVALVSDFAAKVLQKREELTEDEGFAALVSDFVAKGLKRREMLIKEMATQGTESTRELKDEAEIVVATTLSSVKEKQILKELGQLIILMTAPTQEGKGTTMMQTKQMKGAIGRETVTAKEQPIVPGRSLEQTSEVSGNKEQHQSHSLESKSLEIAKKEIELLQNQVRIAEEPHSWVIYQEEVELTEAVLGRGGYGVVKVAMFRGIRVAAKVLHQVILSVYNQKLFIREMTIAAKIRHPNLLLFIGATREGEAIILTELMPTSLQKELERSDMQREETISIAQDVACALRYLHQWRHSPIIHRDISSANVLLEPLRNGWRAKVSDYGSANFMNSIKTAAPGNPAYAAPEARYPDQHSPKMDTFSYGVLLIEMCVRRLPAPNSMEREAQILQIQWAPMASLVRRCISERPADRPSMRDIMELLASIKLTIN